MCHAGGVGLSVQPLQGPMHQLMVPGGTLTLAKCKITEKKKMRRENVQ